MEVVCTIRDVEVGDPLDMFVGKDHECNPWCFNSAVSGADVV